MSMATRNREPLYERIENALFTAASVIGQGLLLVLFIALLWLYLVVLDGLLNAPQPVEYCTTTPIGTEVCRTQTDWGNQ